MLSLHREAVGEAPQPGCIAGRMPGGSCPRAAAQERPTVDGVLRRFADAARLGERRTAPLGDHAAPIDNRPTRRFPRRSTRGCRLESIGSVECPSTAILQVAGVGPELVAGKMGLGGLEPPTSRLSDHLGHPEIRARSHVTPIRTARSLLLALADDHNPSARKSRRFASIFVHFETGAGWPGGWSCPAMDGHFPLGDYSAK